MKEKELSCIYCENWEICRKRKPEDLVHCEYFKLREDFEKIRYDATELR